MILPSMLWWGTWVWEHKLLPLCANCPSPMVPITKVPLWETGGGYSMFHHQSCILPGRGLSIGVGMLWLVAKCSWYHKEMNMAGEGGAATVFFFPLFCCSLWSHSSRYQPCLWQWGHVQHLKRAKIRHMSTPLHPSHISPTSLLPYTLVSCPFWPLRQWSYADVHCWHFSSIAAESIVYPSAGGIQH